METRLDLGVLLAMESIATSDIAVSRGALLDSIESAPGPLIFRGSETMRADTVVLPSENFVLGAAPTAGIVSVDLHAGTERVENLIGLETVERMEIDRRTGEVVAAGTNNGEPAIVRTGTSGVAIALDAPATHLDAASGAIAWSDDADRLWAWDARRGVVQVGEATATVTRLSLSGDGACLAVGTTVDVRVLALESRCGDGSDRLIEESARGIDFSPIGQALVLALDNRLVEWELDAASPGRLVAVHGPAIQSVRFSPDGSEILTGGSDGSIRAWRRDGESLETRPPLLGHGEGVRRIRFAPDGTRLVSSSDDGTVIAWTTDTDPRRIVDEAGLPPWLESARPVPSAPDDRLFLYSGDGVVELRDGAIHEVVRTPVDRLIAVNHGDSAHLVSVDASGVSVLGLGVDVGLAYPALSAFDQLAGSAGTNLLVGASRDGSVCVSVAGAEQARCSTIAAIPPECDPFGSIRAVAASADGRYMVIGTDRGRLLSVRTNDLEPISCLSTLFDGGGQVNAIAWMEAREPTSIAVAFDRGGVGVINAQGGGLVLERVLIGHTDSVLAVDAHSDGTLASTGEDGRLMIWGVDVGQPWGDGMTYTRTGPSNPEARVTSVVLGDGIALTTQDGRVYEWDLRLDTWLRVACQIVGRSLNDVEIQRFQLSQDAASRCHG